MSARHSLLALLVLAPVATALPQGDLAQHPGQSTAFIVEAHQGGRAPSLGLVEVWMGRLVHVYDVRGVLRFEDLLIDPNLASDGVDFQLARNAITQEEALTILHPFKTRQFRAALRKTQVGLVPLLDKGVGPNVLPPFSMVPRNAALAVRFDDLLDDGGAAYSAGWPGTVTPQNLRLSTGIPPLVNAVPRVLPDPNHGAMLGDEFHSTRALIGFTRSELQALRMGGPVNLLGLPAALSTVQANVLLRIPTQLDPAFPLFGQVTNLAGNGLGFSGNGSNDPASPTLDVVRAFRSGGETAVTGDRFNGFLPDAVVPQVLGEQPVTITKVGMIGDTLAMDLQFQTLACAWTPRAGDVIETPLHVYEVTADAAAPTAGLASDVRVRLLHGSFPPAPTFGEYTTPWDPSAGALPDCFVRFSPQALTRPTGGVSVDADVQLRFSEPMQPNSVDPFDAFSIRYDLNPGGTNPLYERVVGAITPQADLSTFVFRPTLPLANDGNASTVDAFSVVMQASGSIGPRDLAGNSLLEVLPPFSFSISGISPPVNSKSLALRFSSVDEDGNGAPEVRGQFFYDFARELVRPRQVTRFSAQADPQHISVATMVPISLPVQTPLSPLGSKLMSVWRYHDLGFGLRDESTHNLDLEGLWWEPSGGVVVADAFDEFRMSVSHSEYLPDEAIDNTLLPKHPSSGLEATFNNNRVGPLAVVHQKSKGYTVSPVDLAKSPTGRTIMPWPMNRNVPLANYQRWTWRDTAVDNVAAPNGAGADTQRLLHLGAPSQVGFYPPGEVPTIGLPLLTEFRTYPTQLASGLNAFKVAIAINTSAKPYFRAFSTGGVTSQGQVVLVDPDQASVATGNVGPSVLTSAPLDNAFYYGQADFVVRVSRMHTVWFDTLGASTFGPPTIVPDPARQPAGTKVLLSYRGASSIASATAGSWEDAENLDPYGNSYTAAQHCQLLGVSSGCPAAQLAFQPTFFPNPGSKQWKGNLADLDGARYVQVRVTLIADPVTGATPELSAIGLTFLQ